MTTADRAAAGLESAERALRESHGTYRIIDADLSEAAAVRKLVADAEERNGGLHGVVNVVGGIGGLENFAPLLDPEAPAICDRILEHNLKATLLVSTDVARHLAARQQPGSIVQLASTTGFVSMPYGAGYAAAKAALVNLTRTMAVEWGHLGIRVNAIAVGMIRTGRSRETVAEVDDSACSVVPLGRVGRPEEIAGPVLFLLSDLAAYVTGAILHVDGGSMARAPYNDASDLPVFVNDPTLRARLLGR